MSREANESRHLEERLRESEERYRLLVESSTVGIVVIQERKLVSSNQAGAEIFGASGPADLLDLDLLDLILPEDLDRVVQHLDALDEPDSETPSIEARVCGLDGVMRDIAGSARATTFQGAPAFQAILRDISKLRRAEHEQALLELQLQEARKLESLGVLAGGIAHDFNNLLAVILGNVRFARQGISRNSEFDEALADAAEAAESAARLTKQLLAYAGRRSPDVRAVDISEMIRENSTLIGSTISRGVALEFQLADDDTTVHADAVQLEQIVMNLAINSAEAIGGRRGTVTIATGRTNVSRAEVRDWIGGEDLDGGEYVYLEVRDTGCGMDDETRQRIFEPFFTTKSHGHGLGLSAALGLVRGHRGAISIDTHPGRGTRLRVHLPASRDGSEWRDEIRAGDDARWDGNFFVVSSTRDRGRPMAGVLRERGAEVIEVAAGSTAIDQFRTHGEEVDAGLIELGSADLLGADLALELRALRPDLPLLIVSDDADDPLARRLARDAPTAVLEKPYSDTALWSALRALLGKSPDRDAAAFGE